MDPEASRDGRGAEPLAVTCRKPAFRTLARQLPEPAAAATAPGCNKIGHASSLRSMEQAAAAPDAATHGCLAAPVDDQLEEARAEELERMTQLLDVHLDQAAKLATAMVDLTSVCSAQHPASQRHCQALQRLPHICQAEKQLRRKLQQLQQYHYQLGEGADHHSKHGPRQQDTKLRVKQAAAGAATQATEHAHVPRPVHAHSAKSLSPVKDIAPPQGGADTLWQAVQQLGLDPSQLLAAQTQAHAQALAQVPGLGLGLGLGLGMGLGLPPAATLQQQQRGQSPPSSGSLLHDYQHVLASRQQPLHKVPLLPQPPHPAAAQLGRAMAPSAFQAHALMRQLSGMGVHDDTDSVASDECDLAAPESLLDTEEDRTTWSSSRTGDVCVEPSGASRKVSGPQVQGAAGCQLPKAKAAPVADLPLDAVQPQRAASGGGGIAAHRPQRRRFTEGPEALRFGPTAVFASASNSGGTPGGGTSRAGHGGLAPRNSEGAAAPHARLPTLREQETSYAPKPDPPAPSTSPAAPALGAAPPYRGSGDGGALAVGAGPSLPPLAPRRRSGPLPQFASPLVAKPGGSLPTAQSSSSPPQPPALLQPQVSRALGYSSRPTLPQAPAQHELLEEISDGSSELGEDDCLVLEPEPKEISFDTLTELQQQLPSSRFEFPSSVTASRAASAPLAQAERHNGRRATADGTVTASGAAVPRHTRAPSADDAQLSAFDLAQRPGKAEVTKALAVKAGGRPFSAHEPTAAAVSAATAKAAPLAVKQRSHNALLAHAGEAAGGHTEALKRPSSGHQEAAASGARGAGTRQGDISQGFAVHRLIGPVEERSEDEAKGSPAASPAAAAATASAQIPPAAETGVGALKRRMMAALSGRWA